MGPVAAVDFSCCSQMGPSFEDVVDNLSDWPEMYVFWTVGAAAFAVVVGVYVYMTMNHLSAPPNPVRNLILGIFSLLPVCLGVATKLLRVIDLFPFRCMVSWPTFP